MDTGCSNRCGTTFCWRRIRCGGVRAPGDLRPRCGFFFALTGALAAIRPRLRLGRHVYPGVRHRVSAVALIRDGLFIQQGPPAIVADGRYLVVILLGLPGRHGDRRPHPSDFQKTIAYIDALGLGAYAGGSALQKALPRTWSIPARKSWSDYQCGWRRTAARFIVRVEPLMAEAGPVLRAGRAARQHPVRESDRHQPLSASKAALIAIGATFAFRVLTMLFNWQTKAVRPWFAGHGKETSKVDDEARKQEQGNGRGKE